MSEFVRYDAGKQGQNEQYADNRGIRTALIIVGKADPQQQKKESDVNSHLGAEYACNRERPGHVGFKCLRAGYHCPAS